VPAQNEKVYSFASLSGYSLKQRLMVRAADLAFYAVITLIGITVRFRVSGNEHLEQTTSAGPPPIYAAWHDRIFLGTWFFRGRGIVFLTSQSFDGEYIARFLQRFGYGAIRGSSTRGGTAALVEMIRGVRRGLPMGFTVDGPKGPRHVAKSGAVLLAKKTGSPILPFVIEPKRFFSVNSWDRLQIPIPFTAAQVIIAEPITVPGDASPEAIEEKLAELQLTLDTITERARQMLDAG
jgi:lysophospholipid acyltransferase (LPLAT)-like uncharacterized protein